MPLLTKPGSSRYLMMAALVSISILTSCETGTLIGASCSGQHSDAKDDVQAIASPPMPNTPAPEKQPTHALHNLHTLTPTIITGSVPEDDAGFAELKSLGVKTIISVDGSSPLVDKATANGMRYVHIPTTYATVTEEQKLDIARAIRDLPGPVYIHCHHGKHRGPAATAAACVALGQITPQQGLDYLKLTGTAPNYTGLYAAVQNASPATPEQLNQASSAFPSVHKAQGITAAMVEVDLAFEHLTAISKAGWTTPKDSPDLVPAAEAGRLADNLRISHEDPKCKDWGKDFESKLYLAIANAGDLEEAIVQSDTPQRLEMRFKAIGADCKSCHSVYRDKVR